MSFLGGLGQDKIHVLKRQSAFYLAGTSPPNKTIHSLGPLCSCGEESILDKSEKLLVLLR